MANLELRMGDWELSEIDPLSPMYKPPLERGFEKLIETFYYIFDLYFGKDDKDIKRGDYGLLSK